MKKIILASLATTLITSVNLLSIAPQTETINELAKQLDTLKIQPTKSDIAGEKLSKLLSTKPDWVASAKNTVSISKNINALLAKVKNNKNKNLEAKLYKVVASHINKMAKSIEGVEEIKTEAPTLKEITKKSKEVLLVPVNVFLKPLHAAQSLVRSYVEDIIQEDLTIIEIIKITDNKPLIIQFLDTKKDVDSFFEKELNNIENTIQLCLEIISLTDPIFKFI